MKIRLKDLVAISILALIELGSLEAFGTGHPWLGVLGVAFLLLLLFLFWTSGED